MGISSIIYHFKMEDESDDYESHITTAADILKKNITPFFESSEKTISEFNDYIKNTSIGNLTKNELDTKVNTILSNQDYIKGVVIFSQDINYIFLLDKDTRTTTYTNDNDSLLNWVRMDKHLKPLSEWTDTYNFFLNRKSRDLLRNFYDSKERSAWLKIKSEITGRKNLTVLLNKTTSGEGKQLILIYIFKTSDFSSFLLKEVKYENPVLSFLTDNGSVFTPIAYNDSLKEALLSKKEERIKEIFRTWEKNYGGTEARSFTFEMDKKVYWLRIDTLNNKLGIKAFALVFSQDSLQKIYGMIGSTFLLAGLFFILLSAGIIVYLVIRNRKAKKANSVPGKPEPLPEEKITELIRQGESGNVEYKSSLRYDYRQEKENKALEDVILKSIAAFTNGRGGVLFIGVDDNGNVLGLKNDFETLKKSDVDYFELHLRTLINNQFGIHFSDFYLRIQFPRIGDKYICVISINPSEKPVYINVKNKQGQWVEKFYVRLGNSSQEITSLKEIEEYIHHRFKRK
jgi:hypothetical protein